MPQPVFIGSEIYRGSTYGPKHPLAIPRVSTVMDLCRALGWFAPGQYVTSPRAKPAALHLFHTPEYITALQQAERDQAVTDAMRERHALGTISNPIFPEMFRRPATAAGGSMLGAELIANGGVVYNPGGGTHHGFPDRAGGFCYLNDPVLAIRTLLDKGLNRITYVDIDAHHCDGVDAAFHSSEQVRLISVHEARRWPFTGHLHDDAGGAAFNFPAPRALNDDEFAMILDQLILPATEAFRPEAIVLQCGADAVAEDPLSRLTLSNNAHWDTVAALHRLSPRFLVLGGGGYNPWSVARLWAGVWATLSGHPIPDQLPAEARAVLGALTWHRAAGRRPPDSWISRLRDARNSGPIRDEVRQILRQLCQRL